jgi:hypothetical protein
LQSYPIAVLTDGTREFFGDRLDNARKVIKTGLAGAQLDTVRPLLETGRNQPPGVLRKPEATAAAVLLEKHAV